MRFVILAGLLAITAPAAADELDDHHKICEAHRIGVRIDKYVEGFEGCEAVLKAWRASQPGKAAAAQKEKDAADKAKIDSFAKGLSK